MEFARKWLANTVEKVCLEQVYMVLEEVWNGLRHIKTLKDYLELTTYQPVPEFAGEYQTRMVAVMGFWEQVWKILKEYQK